LNLRMACPCIVAPVFAVVAVFGIARAANAEDPPMPVDAARLAERYAIEPGSEPLFAEMLGQGQPLPGGCTFGEGKIERTAVLATYTCVGGQVVLQLLHPSSIPSGGVRTERFAIAVTSGTPPAGLVEAIAGGIRAREAAFEWTEVGGSSPPPRRWPLPVAGGAAAAILAFWALRHIALRRKRSG
jgi:hypothetical protein